MEGRIVLFPTLQRDLESLLRLASMLDQHERQLLMLTARAFLKVKRQAQRHERQQAIREARASLRLGSDLAR